jgi:hypothetical protein
MGMAAPDMQPCGRLVIDGERQLFDRSPVIARIEVGVGFSRANG